MRRAVSNRYFMKKVLTEKRGVFKEFDKKMSFLLNLS
jgi:hypothetical protein